MIKDSAIKNARTGETRLSSFSPRSDKGEEHAEGAQFKPANKRQIGHAITPSKNTASKNCKLTTKRSDEVCCFSCGQAYWVRWDSLYSFPYQILEHRKLGKAGAAKPSKRHSAKVEDSGLTEYQQKRASLIDTSLTPIRPLESPDAVQEQNKERVKNIKRILIAYFLFYLLSPNQELISPEEEKVLEELLASRNVFSADASIDQFSQRLTNEVAALEAVRLSALNEFSDLLNRPTFMPCCRRQLRFSR